LDELINLPKTALRTIAKSYEPRRQNPHHAHTAVLRFRKWHREAQARLPARKQSVASAPTEAEERDGSESASASESEAEAASRRAKKKEAELKSVPEGVEALLTRFTGASHVSSEGRLLKQVSIRGYADIIRRLYKTGHLSSLDELINVPKTALRTIAKSYEPRRRKGTYAHTAVLRFRKWHREAHPDVAQLECPCCHEFFPRSRPLCPQCTPQTRVTEGKKKRTSHHTEGDAGQSGESRADRLRASANKRVRVRMQPADSDRDDRGMTSVCPMGPTGGRQEDHALERYSIDGLSVAQAPQTSVTNPQSYLQCAQAGLNYDVAATKTSGDSPQSSISAAKSSREECATLCDMAEPPVDGGHTLRRDTPLDELRAWVGRLQCIDDAEHVVALLVHNEVSLANLGLFTVDELATTGVGETVACELLSRFTGRGCSSPGTMGMFG
jgi:hypothetical protein